VATPELDVSVIAPMIAVAVGVLLLPLADVLLAGRKTVLGTTLTRALRGKYLAAGSAIVLVFALVQTLNGAHGTTLVFNASNEMMVMDGVTQFLIAVVLLGAILTVLVSSRFLANLQTSHAEYYALVLASVVGMMFLVSATDLMMLFLSLELMSIPVYALAGIRRGSLKSNESAIKYFLIGSFASAILLYGTSLLYGATGSLSIYAIGREFDPESPLALLGAGLVLIGFAFKIASVPFHQWAPDTYEGAPTSVSGFMATAVKVAAFGALVRIVAVAFQPAADAVFTILWVLAVLSMTVGNLMAIIQRNAKRMLAYSSIAHAGYLLVGVLVGGTMGHSAVLFYLLIYTFMTIGAFAVIALLARDGEEHDRIEDLAGLIQTRPFPAIVMAICMFSLAGIPFTAGFMGKFQLFLAAIERGIASADTWLLAIAVIGVLNSAISLTYYLRIPLVMFMQQPPKDSETRERMSFFEYSVLSVCGAVTLLLGVVPQDVFVIVGDVDVLKLARDAAEMLLSP
jgi:NADH-quinone oxidoreductase subunit N